MNDNCTICGEFHKVHPEGPLARIRITSSTPCKCEHTRFEHSGLIRNGACGLCACQRFELAETPLPMNADDHDCACDRCTGDEP